MMGPDYYDPACSNVPAGTSSGLWDVWAGQDTYISSDLFGTLLSTPTYSIAPAAGAGGRAVAEDGG